MKISMCSSSTNQGSQFRTVPTFRAQLNMVRSYVPLGIYIYTERYALVYRSVYIYNKKV